MGELLRANYATNTIEEVHSEEHTYYMSLSKEALVDMLLSAKATIEILESELAGVKHDKN